MSDEMPEFLADVPADAPAITVAEPEVMAQPATDPAAADPLGWMMHMAHRGNVIDEGRAMMGSCTDLYDPAGTRVGTYKDGVMGFLDDDQQERFCMTRERADLDEQQASRIRDFVAASEACSGEDSPS
ncbi:MAG: hypothetical protein KGK07_16870, partial [Chloroflexota bacterium]|nr:hypothetical protein [Chloroflexota bacterium]